MNIRCTGYFPEIVHHYFPEIVHHHIVLYGDAPPLSELIVHEELLRRDIHTIISERLVHEIQLVSELLWNL